MKKTVKKAISAVLAAATVLSLVIASVFAASNAVDGEKSPKDIQRIVVDCRNAEAFAKTSHVYVHTPTAAEPDPYTGGKYSFNKAMSAMEVEYNSGAAKGNEFRILTMFNGKNSISTEYKYFVVVYAAKTESPFSISIWNGGRQGNEMFPVKDGKDTKAKFVASDPVDISSVAANGWGTLVRLINGSHSTIKFVSGDKDARFFIREYAFFKSPEDAKAYYAGVDLEKDPVEYGENAIAPAAPTTPTTPAQPAAEPKLIPVIMSFEGEEAFAKNSRFQTFTDDKAKLEGDYEFVTLDDGTKCLKLKPHKYTGADGSVANSLYRMMPTFKTKNILGEQYKYVRVTYMTNDKDANTITLQNNANGKKVVLASDTSVSKGEFVIGEPADIFASGIAGRYVNGTHSTFSYTSKSEKAEIYIKEMAFFSNLEDAKEYNGVIDPTKYTASAQSGGADVYDHKYTVIPDPDMDIPDDEPRLDPVIMSFEGADALAKNARFQFFFGATEGIGGLQTFVTLDDGTQCVRLDKHVYTGKDGANLSNYRMMPVFKSGGIVTEQHKYVRVTYMTTDIVPNSLVIMNNANGAKATIAADTSLSRGEFVVSEPVDISARDILKRYVNGVHCTINYNTSLDNAVMYIKEIAFFSSKAQAYEYYNDSLGLEGVNVTTVNFGNIGNGIAVREYETWGNHETTDETLDIVYSDNVHWANIAYMAKIKPAQAKITNKNQRYMRILYSADNPDGVEKASMILQDDANGVKVLVSDNVTDTNGAYVLSPPVVLSENMALRFSNSVFCTLFTNVLKEGGRYSIKAAYFFTTREEAEVFTVSDDKTELTIAGNDISKYQIVVSKDATLNIKGEAENIQAAILKMTGIKVPVVTDEAAISEYEILIGLSNRPLTTAYIDEMKAVSELSYRVFVEGNTLVITSPLALATVSAARSVNSSLFYNGAANFPETVTIPADYSASGVNNTYVKSDFWSAGDPVEAPVVFTEDFDVNDGYFNEDNGEANWSYADGAYKTDATAFASSYLHVYEKNVTYKATLTYKTANGGNMGIMARVNSEDAFVKAGYDFAKNAWYIDSRDGRDYFLVRVAEAAAVIAPDTAYELVLTVMGDTATLTVNGETVIADAKVTHTSPGRLGMYAENASVTVDNVEIALSSGQGTILKNVAHTKLPDEVYREGGSVFERADGSLTYVHQSGAIFKSLDNGITWERTEAWSDNHKHSYVNMFKLATGEWIRIVTRGGTNKASQISTDDGMTWTDGGIICETKYKGTTAIAGNMNDKITQGTDGRIYYVQAYESTASTGADGNVAVEGRYIFCRYYFSDDKGMTWQKGADSWEIPGNDEAWFGENKLLECADGTIRMYCSWNFMGNVVYADSTDGGKTFGPLQFMENMPCPTSSMQFVKDEYADNEYTYYMVWVNAEQVGGNSHTPRSRLSLAKTTDGKNWVYLGDIWRWECTYLEGTTLINHVVDPFIKTTEDYIICGSGFSDGQKIPNEGGATAHQGQRQHIYSIRKDTLPVGIPMEEVIWR